ncbi:SIR2 family NAD-dependent protein deacylase [Psychrobacter sp. LV10R520-6]|uniref:SIR2 family NAD-dependent protein deacylase n=1 Tax=Psychrobacter sp. LV10R520-6 TaxID=1415574 RepID=UPI002AA0E3E2|nr:Sir2 family NAD-dependent protein deacetylase [Psychrobacter sp. LV10R520-6]
MNCGHCDGYIRPDIVWFGESLPIEAWQTAENAAANCEVFISIGTSSLVYPAAGLAQIAKQNGAKIIEINPNPTPNTVVDITLVANAGVVMPQLFNQISALFS